MPYIRPQGAPERASRLGHVRTALDPTIREALTAFHLPPAPTGRPPIANLLIEGATLPTSTLPRPTYAVSVDGSMQEVEVRPDFPSARVGFAQIAGVFSNLSAFSPVPRGGFIDPTVLARATNAALVKGVVPTSVVTMRPQQTLHEAWREAVSDLFAACRLDGPTGVTTTLTEVLAHVLGGPGTPVDHITLEKCPGRHDRGCSNGDIAVPIDGATCTQCHVPLYFSDATNTHDEVVEDGSNQTALGRLMSVLEMLTFLWQVQIFANADAGRVLPRTAFILDGPLAMFGRPAGLKRPALRFLQALHSEERREDRPGLPVIIGVEKTGALAEHADQIAEHIPPGYLLTLPDSYIRDHVQHRSGSRAYGYDTDYGRRFVYRTRDERVIVFSTPPLPTGEPTDDALSVDVRRYPNLDTTLELLDRVGTLLYRNAVIPVALAHNFASLPLGTGSQVLTYLAQDSLGIPRTTSRPTPVAN